MFKRFISGSLYYGLSSIIGRLIGFIMLPIYTSKLTPEDYGAVSFMMLYVALIQLLFGSKLDQAVINFYSKKKNKIEKDRVWYSALISSSVVIIVPLLFGVIYSEYLSLILFNSNKFSLAVKLFSLNILLTITEGYALLYFRLIDLRKYYFYLTLAKLLLQLILNVFLVVYLEMGVVGVAISSCLAYLFTSVIGLHLAVKGIRRVGFDFRIVKKMYFYSWPLWLTAIFGMYLSSIQQPIINFFESTTDLGVFSLGNTLGSIIVVIFWGPFLSFWQVERYKIVEEGGRPKTFEGIFYVVAYLSCVLSIGIGFLSYPVVDIMSSNKGFLGASSVAFPLAMSFTFTYLGYYMNFPFLLKEANSEILLINIWASFMLTLLLPLSAYYGGIVEIAQSMMVANYFIFILTSIKSKKYMDMRLSTSHSALLLLLPVLLFYMVDYSILQNVFSSLADISLRFLLSLLLAAILLVVYLSYAYYRGLFGNDIYRILKVRLLGRQ